MQLELKTALEIAGILIMFGGLWRVMEWRMNSHGNQLQKLWDYKDKHEEEAARERLILYQSIAKLEGVLEAKSKENLEIMRRLEHIDSNIIEMKEDLAELRVLRRREE